MQVTEVACPVACSGVLAMRPLLLHASSKSQTQDPRRILHIEYAASLDIAEDLELVAS